MKKVKCEIHGVKKNVNVPESWDEVTVGQYGDILNIDVALPNINQRMIIVSVLLSLPFSDVAGMFSTDFEEIEKLMEWFKQPMPSTKVQDIDIKGEKYYLYTDFEKLTMGEQISIDLLTKKSGGNMLTVYPELLCLFLRKKLKGKFEAFHTDNLSRADLFKTVPITQVNSLMLFFSNGVTK